MNRSPLSVVIISCARPEELRLLLGDLAGQAAAGPFEVVLVLQRYEEAFAGQLRRDFGQRLALLFSLHPQPLGVHGARNVGLQMAGGAVVAFLDDECRLRPDWAATLLSYYRDPRLGGVGGYIHEAGARPPLRRWYLSLFGLAPSRYRIDWGGFSHSPDHAAPDRDQPADWLPGGNMSFRREAIEKVGGFDEEYGPYDFDDVDYGLRVRRAGYTLLSSARLAVDHLSRPRHLDEDYFSQIRDGEARRLRFVRKAIGDKPLWRWRYRLRLAIALVALGLVGCVKGDFRLPRAVWAGARLGMRRIGRS